MILIFGSQGYVGSAIVAECERREIPYMRGRRGDTVVQINDSRIELIINAAAFIPSPTVDACKIDPHQTILSNVVFPNTLSMVCSLKQIPLMHLSTGCLFDEQREYAEDDEPTRGWDGYCGFYVGTKLTAEAVVRLNEAHYILRLRLPFDEVDHPRNYLSKLATFDKVFEHVNSLTHRGDFAKWALDLWQKKAPFGTYHCVNTGNISATGIAGVMQTKGIIKRSLNFVKSLDTTGALLSNAKLKDAIGYVRSVGEAVADSLNNWKPKS